MKKSEFELWINEPNTRQVLKILTGELQQYEKALIEGVYAREPSMEQVAGKYIYTTAYISGLKFILQDIVNHLEEDIKEDE